MQNENRNYSIDLLRIIMMFLIVLGHCCTHTEIRENVTIFSFDWFGVWSIQTITTCAVNVFVLITGFFYDKNQFSLKKIIRLWCAVSTVSLLGYFFTIMIGRVNISLKGIIEVIFPILSKQYWFFTVYFLLMFFAPFLSELIKSISKENHKVLVGIIIVAFYILPVFSIIFPEFDAYEGYSIVGFISLFIIGAYIKRSKFGTKKTVLFMFVMINSVIMLLSKIVLEIAANRLSLNFGTGLFYHINTIFQLVQAILLFLIVSRIKVKSLGLKKVINKLSVNVFIVYLIHDNPNVRMVIWDYVKLFFESENVVCVVLISSTLVFLISLIMAIVVCPLSNMYTNALIKMIGQNRIIKVEKYLHSAVERTGDRQVYEKK